MNYCEFIKADCANGPGVRGSLFVSGCTNRCDGCFQPQTWDFDYGKPFTKEVEQMILDEVSKPYYRGLTLLGGEPFEPCNQAGLINLLKEFKKRNPNKDICAFAGFTYDIDLVEGGRKYTAPFTDQILDLIDVLVDGRFMIEEKDVRLKFRGSRNQRIIDMKSTRKTGSVVLSEYN